MSGLLQSFYRKIYSVLGNRGLTRFGIIARANQMVTGKLAKKEKSVVVDGNTIYLLEKNSAISAALPLLGEVEPATTEAFRKIVKEGDTVLDLGANIGYYTVLFAKKAGKTGKVFAFEPDPVNLEILRKNIAANGYGNVVVVEKAVSDKNEKVKFYLGDTSDASSIYNFAGEQKTIEVDAVSLDEYFGDYEGKIDVIKMDIQGAEYAALNGMRALLKKNPGVKVIAEFAPGFLKDCGVDSGKYLDLLDELGFEIYDINERKRKVEKTTKEAIMKEYYRQDDCTNLYCVRKGASESIESI